MQVRLSRGQSGHGAIHCSRWQRCHRVRLSRRASHGLTAEATRPKDVFAKWPVSHS